MTQHSNDVLVEGNWHVVRNERPYDMYGKKKKYIWFTLYHNHEHWPNLGMCSTERSAGPSDGTWMCGMCTKQVPDVVAGYMNLIKWSMEDADA